MTLEELLVALGYEYDPKDMKKFQKDLESTKKAIGVMAKAAVAGATAVVGLAVASTRASDEQGKLAEEIGESVENIDALQFALARSGGQADSMGNSLRQLSIRAAEAARGTGSGVEAFGILGVSVMGSNGQLKSASQLMLEVSGRMQGLSRLQQIELADKLGLTDSIRLLQQGPAAIQELTAEARALGVTTAEDAELAAMFQDSLTDIWRVAKQVSRVVTRELVPILESLANQFTEWWKTNRALIEQNMPKWIEGLTTAVKLLTIAAGTFIALKLLTTFATLLGLIRKLTVASLLMNGALFIMPALVAAAALAFIGLVQDAVVHLEGGQSVLGDLIKMFPEWETEIDTVATVMAGVYDLTMLILTGWKEIIDLFSADNKWEKFKEFMDPRTQWGFLGDVTGLARVDGTGVIPEAGSAIAEGASSVSRSLSNYIDKIEIVIQDTTANAAELADEVFNRFQQTSEELNSTVEQ